MVRIESFDSRFDSNRPTIIIKLAECLSGQLPHTIKVPKIIILIVISFGSEITDLTHGLQIIFVVGFPVMLAKRDISVHRFVTLMLDVKLSSSRMVVAPLANSPATAPVRANVTFHSMKRILA